MRLVLKDEKYTFTVTKAAEPRTEYGSGQQKMNRATKLPEWVVEVLALDSERGEVIRVTVTGDQPKSPRVSRSVSRSWKLFRGPTTAATGWLTALLRFIPLRRPAPPEPGSDGTREAGRNSERPAIRSPLSTCTERITSCHDQRHHIDHGRQRR